MDIKKWLNKSLKIPIISILFLNALVLCFLVLFFTKDTIHTRDVNLDRVTSNISFAINIRNAQLLDGILLSGIHEVGASKIIICNSNQHIIYSLPKSNDVRCDARGDIFENVILRDVIGYEKLKLIYYIDYKAYVALAVLVLLFIIVCSFLCVYFYRKILNNIRLNIIIPIQHIYEEKNTVSGIDDINKMIKTIVEHREISVRLEKQSAIAKTTQMLAHDVRKPFTILKGIIGVLGDAKDTHDFKSKLPIMLDEVQRSITSVDGLIKDVLEIGRSDDISPESTSLQTLFEIFLNDLAKVYMDSEIEIESEFKTFVYANIETNKVLRVFLNIAGNAIEAMKHKGQLWIKTDLVEVEDKPFIEIRIGNNGPAIPSDVIPKLFESFYTSGKKGGTGLGLAIAKKIVEAHGGTIRCESEEMKGTEFIFTLPALKAKVSENFALDKTLKEYQRSPTDLVSIEDRESRFEREILGKIRDTSEKITLLLVDDEAIYRQTLVKLLTLNSDIAAHLEILHAGDSKEAYEKLEHLKIDIVILDIDLGKNSENGLEIVAKLNGNKFSGKICIHSNRFLSSDHMADLRVDKITRKPMDRSEMLELIFTVVEKFVSVPDNMETKLFNIAVVEDNVSMFYLINKEIIKYANVVHFKTPEELLKYDSKNKLDMLITDQNFEPFSTLKGDELAATLKEEMKFLSPIVLASLEGIAAQNTCPHLACEIDKTKFSWNQIEGLLPKNKKMEEAIEIIPQEITLEQEEKNLPSEFDFARKRIPNDNLSTEELALLRKLVHDLRSIVGSFLWIYDMCLKFHEDESKLDNLRMIAAKRIDDIKPFLKEKAISDFALAASEFLDAPNNSHGQKIKDAIYKLLGEIGSDPYFSVENKSMTEQQKSAKNERKYLTILFENKDYEESIRNALSQQNLGMEINSDESLSSSAVVVTDLDSALALASNNKIPTLSCFEEDEERVIQRVTRFVATHKKNAKERHE